MNKIAKIYTWIFTIIRILATGAFKPQDGFKNAFENRADYTCLGIFDYQVIEDSNILTDTLKNLQNRKRKFI